MSTIHTIFNESRVNDKYTNCFIDFNAKYAASAMPLIRIILSNFMCTMDTSVRIL
jgi:hypothetical protein